MYLQKLKTKDGRFFSIIHKYRDKQTKSIRSKTVLKVGYLDVLEKEYTNPISHFEKTAYVKKITVAITNTKGLGVFEIPTDVGAIVRTK